MRKTSKPFLILFALILLVMSLPLNTSEWLRGSVVAIFAPIWEFVSPLQVHGKSVHIDKGMDEYPKNPVLNIKKPSRESIPATIIFRSLSTWNSSLWINVGTESNTGPPPPIIAKNSPVLVGDSVVGVVDYVGKHQSRVRLITDSGLVPSVRVARGYEQNKTIAENVSDLVSFVNYHPDLFQNSQEKIALEIALKDLYLKLSEKKNTWYLAKGEIHGQSHPHWRTDSHILRGSGFNYDFEDELGPARELRSGEPVEARKDFKAMPLVKVHDLLVTTGMDGVFPPGLKVAVVTKIDILHEGDYAYELDAKSTVDNLDDLTVVYVIAPLGYDERDQPEMTSF